MPYPSGPQIILDNLDSDTDSPRLARQELKLAIEKINDLLAFGDPGRNAFTPTYTSSVINDWSHADNSQPGVSQYTLTGGGANGPDLYGPESGSSFISVCFVVDTKKNAEKLFQFAIPISGINIYYRRRLSGVWGAWLKLFSSYNTVTGALVYKNTDQLITHGIGTVINWQASDYNTNSVWSGVNPSRLTVPTGVSKVRIKAYVRYDTGIYDRVSLYLLKNGTTYNPQYTCDDERAGHPTASITPMPRIESPIMSVVAGDYFEIATLHINPSSADRSVKGGPTKASWATMETIVEIRN